MRLLGRPRLRDEKGGHVAFSNGDSFFFARVFHPILVMRLQLEKNRLVTRWLFGTVPTSPQQLCLCCSGCVDEKLDCTYVRNERDRGSVVVDCQKSFEILSLHKRHELSRTRRGGPWSCAMTWASTVRASSVENQLHRTVQSGPNRSSVEHQLHRTGHDSSALCDK